MHFYLAPPTDAWAWIKDVAFPLGLYTGHGWIATKMALWLLFHPYEPKYILGWQVPFTPGIFPKRRGKLAESVASTITETLLTTSDIRAQAENLVTEHNIYLAVDGMVGAVLTEFRDTTKLHRLANELSELAPVFLENLVASMIESVESGKHRHIAVLAERLFDYTVLNVRISRVQADDFAAWVMENIVTPATVRAELIRLLSPQNIASLEDSINSHASGPYKLLAKIIGVKRVCYEWRNFLEKEPESAEKIIGELLKQFNIEEQISTRLAQFDLRSMPLQTVERLRAQWVQLVEEFLLEHKEDILQAVRGMQGPAVNMVQTAIIRFNPETVRPEWLDRVKQSMTQFCYGYLKQELGGLLERAIPALGVYGIISRKISLFTPQQLEEVIKRICKNELGWLEFLGGVIGLWLGFVQVFVNLFWH